jgi:hypothetical protein
MAKYIVNENIPDLYCCTGWGTFNLHEATQEQLKPFYERGSTYKGINIVTLANKKAVKDEQQHEPILEDSTPALAEGEQGYIED